MPTSRGGASGHVQQVCREVCHADVMSACYPCAASSGLRAAAKIGVMLVMGFTAGYLSTSSRQVQAPAAPLNASHALLDLQAPLVDDGLYPPPFFIGDNRVCGAARCHPGDTCCPAAPGFGFACGARSAVCCQGNRGSVVCAERGTCCRNRYGAAYCCAEGNECQSDVCVAGQGGYQCFPGESEVQVVDIHRETVRGSPMQEVRIGDAVLVQNSYDEFTFQPILSFLHSTEAVISKLITIVHSGGELKASPSHLILTVDDERRQSTSAENIRIGDQLVMGTAGAPAKTTTVLSVHGSHATTRMLAPLTASGTVVVDGVTASNYAASGLGSSIPHIAVHASFFPVRFLRVMAYAQLHSPIWPFHAAFISFSSIVK
eukprot:TRINITY_DN101552_c0_g1_i1.p1 TRINITY_DN101552_c0_g1~~TRINITY_DN101552_c0_g1_i1.p1  ORF type:complete len:374 (-),score=41.85 TRINITY_DN101552_c0_g1_i1:263-1384(-)